MSNRIVLIGRNLDMAATTSQLRDDLAGCRPVAATMVAIACNTQRSFTQELRVQSAGSHATMSKGFRVGGYNPRQLSILAD